ncbi:MAG: MBL fold metallo-hydrolase [Methanomicrobiales archaeon]|nr:MBL fold metallo-hydrolase [Methanomicrobiales archaeon]
MKYRGFAMILTVLVDNHTLTDRYFRGEPGLSFLIEEGDQRILFDTGFSGLFLENAALMEIDLLDLDIVVLSHGHIDHTGGLSHLIDRYILAAIEGIPFNTPLLLAHPHAFLPRRAGLLPQIGLRISPEELARHFTVKSSREPVWLTDRLVFLGGIPRPEGSSASGEKKRFLITPEGEVEDRVMDDTGLACVTDDGIVVITGCAHAGIDYMVARAQEVSGEDRVADVIGGFHLLNPPSVVRERVLGFMEQAKPRILHPCHCTDLASKTALSRVAPVGEVGVGLRREYG